MRLGVNFTPSGWEDYRSWSGDRSMRNKIDRLIDDIRRDPSGPGIGKPELLKYDLHGYAARRITGEHRLVYRIDGDTILILSCRYHYEKG